MPLREGQTMPKEGPEGRGLAGILELEGVLRAVWDISCWLGAKCSQARSVCEPLLALHPQV